MSESSDERGGHFSNILHRHKFDLGASILLVAWVVVSRVPFADNFATMGKDGGLYIHSLALDRTYDVPMPGNIGYVVLGKVANGFLPNPVHAFEAVNIVLSAVGVVFTYLFAAMVVARPLAAATAFAMASNAMVWWHGDLIASYPVWLAVLPALGFFGLRFVRGHRFADLIGSTVALGLGMILRPDLLFFGAPLWFGCLAIGRARPRDWVIAVMILAAACAVWFFGTAAVLGGVGEYLARVRAKHEGDSEGFSIAKKGFFEGLVRNVAKYGLFLVWGAGLVVIPFGRSVVGRLKSTWRGTVLALLWVGPSWAFSFFVFAGNAGLIFPLLPLLYLGAAQGLDDWLGRVGPRAPTIAMACLGLLSTAQFVATPMLRETDQRDVILNVTFFRYTGSGLLSRYNFNLDDYGISPALASVLKQVRSPEPIPVVPPRN